MSRIATLVLSILNEMFPANPHRRVFSEHYVKFKDTRLFFDFYIKELNCLVEVQGRQHIKFVKHFHGSLDNFKAQKYRDNLKIEYVQENNLYLIRIYDGEKVDKNLILYKINKALESEYNYFE